MRRAFSVSDRDELVKRLPRLLQPLVPAASLGRIKDELALYDKQYRQRLGKRWEDATAKTACSWLNASMAMTSSAMATPCRGGAAARCGLLAAVDTDALVDPLQQLRDAISKSQGCSNSSPKPSRPWPATAAID